ncbi:MAG: phosphoribosylanthranilate isomerase [Gemmatimonas sp.]|nr:phosphoribosylanthranilate isomerase [Gemmatimonas sp.]
MAEVKFCGLTRAVDAQAGGVLGAAYLGVVFADGPRRLDAAAARVVLDGARGHGTARRVGVFGAQPVEEIAADAAAASLDIVQLHGTSDATLVDALRQRFDGAIWRVVRLPDLAVVAALRGAEDGVDAVLIDAHVPGALGGTGTAVDWERLASALDSGGRPRRLVLAGGLRPENVERAIGLVAPDVVDVSSGVESTTGIKDHALMRAFAESAARGGR